MEDAWCSGQERTAGEASYETSLIKLSAQPAATRRARSRQMDLVDAGNRCTEALGGTAIAITVAGSFVTCPKPTVTVSTPTVVYPAPQKKRRCFVRENERIPPNETAGSYSGCRNPR